jgi:hypothetical protein
MAPVKHHTLDYYRRSAQYLTMILGALYGFYWVVLAITGTKQSGSVKVVGNVLLILLIAAGFILGMLYAVGSRQSKSDT